MPAGEPPPGGEPDGPFQPFHEVEILKAIGDLASSKAPGPDGIPAEVYKGLPSTAHDIARLFTAMVKRRTIPRESLAAHIVPLDKPRKDPPLCAPKRPISLLCVLLKILEGAIYNKVVHAIEPLLHPPQYAYRRARGCDMHLAPLTDFVAEQLQGGRHVFLASLDISGAFDTVPRNGLMSSLWKTGVDAHLVRFIGAWLRNRRFRARLQTQEGRFFSKPRGMSRGLPQGGILSPCSGGFASTGSLA